jgi:hypothetical protein
MIAAMKMIHGIPFMNSSRSAGTLSTSAMDRAQAQVTRAKARGKMPLPEMKLQMQAVLSDLPGIDAERLKYKIRNARSANELWMIRSDMYQTISKLRSQTEAALRINQLLPCFSQWLPAQQLAAI